MPSTENANVDSNRFMNRALMRCYGIACDAVLKGRADLCGTAANPGQDAAAVRTAVAMRWRGLEPPRGVNPTRPSTLRVYQFRHQRAGRIVAMPSSDADDELAPRVALADVPKSVGNVGQLIAPLDNRLHSPGLEQLTEDVQ